ncbi:ETC complex I subunit conserved region-domain-containing protein, partial [Zopfochytrium polystomum]
AAASSSVVKQDAVNDLYPADLISGVPPEVSRRSSGSARTNHWKIDFDTQPRWENKLMGWASSADPVQSLALKFSSKEDAILFAERQGYDYWVDVPQEPVFKVKSYSDNFKSGHTSKFLPCPHSTPAGKLRLYRTK